MRIKHFIFLSVASVLLLQGCVKEDQLNKVSSFRLSFAGMKDENGSKLQISDDDYSSMIFDEGDVLYVNNNAFSISYDLASNCWRANRTSGSDTLVGTSFECLYFDPTYASKNAAALDGYTVTFGPATTTAPTVEGAAKEAHASPVFAGQTSDSLVTLFPAFAIVRMYNETPYAQQHIGFDDNVAVRKGTVVCNNMTYPTITNPSYFSGIKESTDLYGNPTIKGDLMEFTLDNSSELNEEYAYHVIVPLASSSVTTNLYLRISNGTHPIYKKISGVTLRQGYVYTINYSK